MGRPHVLAAAGLALLVAGRPALAESPRGAFQEAKAAFEREDFAAAAEQFALAAESADQTRLDPAVARYDEGNALLQLNRMEEAASRYTEALRTPDLGLQQHAYHNRGNAMMAVAGEKQQQQDLQGAMETLREAALMYEQAISLDPADQDPKVNYELAWKRIEELQQQQQQDQQQQDQQQQDQQQQDQQQQDQQQQDQQQQDQQQQDQQQQDQQQQDQQQQDQQQQDQQQQDQQQQDQQQPPPRPSEEMTQEEAEMLLNAIREEEEAARRNLRLQYGSDQPVEKDW